MIVASKDLKLSLIEALTSGDTTCINLHNRKEELIICSCYQDITFPDVINNIDKCVEHYKKVNKEIIIGTDSNAHSHWKVICKTMTDEIWRISYASTSQGSD